MARRKFHRYVRALTGVLVLTGWTAIFAQDTPTPGNLVGDASTKNETSTIQGTVVAGAGGEPLRGARLILIPIDVERQDDASFASTDAEGRFTITNAAPGRYHFFASKNGYVQQAYRPDGTEGQETILDLTGGQKLEKVQFKLRLAAVIVGRITDENGEPVAGIEVEALVSKNRFAEGLEMPSLRGQWLPSKVASTNDLGEYRIYGLTPGNYYVAAVDSGVAELAESFALVTALSTQFAMQGGFVSGGGLSGFGVDAKAGRHATVYYPGVLQRSQAEKVRVSAGQEMRIEIRLIPQKTVTVSGRVFDPNGKPSKQTVVLIHSTSLGASSARTMATTDVQGHFEVKRVPPGSYFVSANGDYEKKIASVEQPLEVGAEDVTGLRLQLSGGFEISGKVVVPASSKIKLGPMQVTLSPCQGLEHFGFAEIKEDRTFTTSELHPGTYSLMLHGLPDGWYVSAADFGGQNVLENGLKIGEAGANHALTVTIKAGMGKIEGVVLRNDDPVSGAVVKLFPEHPTPYRPGLTRTAATDQRGHFVIPGVVPGSYRALAGTGEDNESDDENDDLPAGDSSSTSIVVAESESKNLQLKLQTSQQ